MHISNSKQGATLIMTKWKLDKVESTVQFVIPLVSLKRHVTVDLILIIRVFFFSLVKFVVVQILRPDVFSENLKR